MLATRTIAIADASVRSDAAEARDAGDEAADACDPTEPVCDCEGKQRRRTQEIVNNKTTCDSALARGRAANGASRFEEAIAIATAAAETCATRTIGPLLAERGHARLRAAHYADALKDLDEAPQVIDDGDLASRVLIDRAEVSRSLKKSARDVDASLYWANRMTPSQATRDAMTDKSFCPVDVKYVDEDAEQLSGWLAWWQARTSGLDEPSSYLPLGSPGEPQTDADAEQLFCRSCTGSGPWDVPFGARQLQLHVIARANGKLLDFGTVGTAQFGMARMSAPYSYSDGVEVSQVGRFTLVRVISVGRNGHYDLADLVPCDPQPYDVWWISVHRATKTRLVLDLWRGKIVARVNQVERFPAIEESNELLPRGPLVVALTPGPRGFTVSEPACRPIPYRPKR